MNEEATSRRAAEGPYTYEDLLNMPDDRNRYEVIEGELLVTPAPNSLHAWIVWVLEQVLGRHIFDRDLGVLYTAPFDVVFNWKNVAEPDFVFIAKERFDEVFAEEHAIAAPDLAIEILSPSTAKHDRVTKRRTYERFGVKHYLIIDPRKRTLEEFYLDGESYRAGAALKEDETFVPRLFPDLTIELASIWPPKFRKDPRRRPR